MSKSLRHLLTLEEFTSEEILKLLSLAKKIKEYPSRYQKSLEGQSLAMIFDKSSTRTRVSFEVGIAQLGGRGIYLNGNDLQLGRGETISDTAMVLSKYVQGIMIRTYAHKTVIELAEASTVPVINGLTDSHHPCQILADFQTILEHYKSLKGLKMVFVGDGNNVAHSLMIGAAKVGMDFTLVCPMGYEPLPAILEYSMMEGKKNGCRIEMTHRVKGSIKNASVVYTDVWTSMGQESEKKKRLKAFKGFQVNEDLMMESSKALFLHCLPAHRGEEVSAGVIDGPQSRVWDQAENRLHAQKAIMVTLMGTKGKK
jgi:ornithine carbamoyltransferase